MTAKNILSCILEDQDYMVIAGDSDEIVMTGDYLKACEHRASLRDAGFDGTILVLKVKIA